MVINYIDTAQRRIALHATQGHRVVHLGMEWNQGLWEVVLVVAKG